MNNAPKYHLVTNPDETYSIASADGFFVRTLNVPKTIWGFRSEAVNLLTVMNWSPDRQFEVNLSVARNLTDHENPLLRRAAPEFLNEAIGWGSIR